MGQAGHVHGISRSRRWDKEIPHGVLPMEQLVFSDKWARIPHSGIIGLNIVGDVNQTMLNSE